MRNLTLHLLLLVAIATVAVACTTESRDAPTEPATTLPTAAAGPQTTPAGLTRVEDPSLVCMVNDTYMGRAQIRVEVAGKTYFGCCPNCETRLKNEPAVRAAIDPVSGEVVDKASAVLAQDASGAMLYFANEQNLRDYRPVQ